MGGRLGAITAAAAFFAGGASAMETPPPFRSGAQQLIVDTTVMDVNGPPISGAVIGSPLQARWAFDSNVVGYRPIWDFSMQFAGFSYSQGDVDQAEMVTWEGTYGLAGTFFIGGSPAKPALRLEFFEEFGDSVITLEFQTGTFVSAPLAGRYVSAVAEPAAYGMWVAGVVFLLSGLRNSLVFYRSLGFAKLLCRRMANLRFSL